VRLCCLVFAVASSAPAAAAAEAPPRAAVILDAFAKIAFGTEFTRNPDPRLHKWAGPVRWRAEEHVALDAGERAFLDRHIKRLARLTGLDFVPAAGRRDANFLILFVPEGRYRAAIERHIVPAHRVLLPRLAGTSCLGFLTSDRSTDEIESAVSIIPIERARARGLVRSCIAEETTQVLGLRNDSSAVSGTLFDDNGTARDLTALDVILLRLLYHPTLRAGMNRADALAAARDALPGILAAAP
jgi:hypothetical protein